ncbi:glycosyltransferase [Micromonospora okii]|uniref:glycosyltransferase n=1 Tax=Micromonospora okii TaxID=1182970 RepID=UPI001E3BC1EB|nr:glycosyltransferase [Micromonospora okii]
MATTDGRTPARVTTPAAATRPVRVAHVIGCLDRGGAETASLDLCRAVPADEVRQTFLTTAGREGSLAAGFRAAGAEVVQCPFRPTVLFLPRLGRALRSLRPDAVVSHVGLTSALVLLVARLCGVRVRVARIWSEGDGAPDTAARRARRAALRWLLARTATDVLGVTAAALRLARTGPADRRYRVLPNAVAVDRLGGVDRGAARRRWGIPAQARVLGHLGRAAPVKNRGFLVEVHRCARAAGVDTRLLVAGPGGTGDLTAAHPGVTGDPTVVLAGEVETIGGVLAATDVLLLPSLREGLPGVALEALAGGVPVVANDLPCMRELAGCLDGISLVPLAAGPRRWAEVALAEAGAGADRRRQLARAVRSSRFTLPEVAREWRAVWRVPPPE